jgi:extracellular factor (EF) 3-hydroxypalmitic acid methyl ester biosynthesis protein
LHPLVLCAPFARRTYQKPLGYAGDYEMVNMMMRDSREGDSLFAKLFNVWLLSQESAAAHRNRIEYLTQRLVEVVAAATRRERRARVYNLGCGPAWEWQRFLAQSPLSSHAEVVLADFDSETLEHARHVLQNAAERYRRAPSLQFVKKSVQQVIKETFRAGRIENDAPFDLIYCAGLFDYLPDQICRQLTNLFYESLAPGGVVLCTNVAPANANRGSLELILDWHLRCRDRRGMGGLVPPGFPPSQVGICTDLTGSNFFLELRKPDGC